MAATRTARQLPWRSPERALRTLPGSTVRKVDCYTPPALSGPLNEPGQAGAYLALFGEMGLSLLVTTLVGALGGHWIDDQLGTSPIVLIVGFLVGAAAGARLMYQLMNRFLAKIE